MQSREDAETQGFLRKICCLITEISLFRRFGGEIPLKLGGIATLRLCVKKTAFAVESRILASLKMSEYLQVRSNGQITLPAPTRRKAKIKEGDLLEAVVDDDGTIRLVPKLAVDRALAEQYQLDDVAWALKQKDKKE